MVDHPTLPQGQTLRHFTVAVFVVWQDRVLLHFHRKLGRWLPPGGHVEENELPDDAAVREVLEESGVAIRLVGGRGVPVQVPRQLVVPAGVQVEDIYPGHQHVDLVYFASPVARGSEPPAIPRDLAEADRVGWYSAGDLVQLQVEEEIQTWAGRAVREVPEPDGA